MTISVRLKHSSVAAKVPLPGDLADGELGLNINDTTPAIYLKDSAGAVVQVGGVGTEPDATETVKGVVELATQAEVDAGTDDTRAVTPLKLATAVPAATEAVAGKAEIATQAEVDAGTDDSRIVTPLKAATTFVNVAGDTMTGSLTVPNFVAEAGGLARVAGDYLLGLPVGASAAGMRTGTGATDGLYIVGPTEGSDVGGRGTLISQVSAQSISNATFTKRAPSTAGAKFINFWAAGSQSGSISLQTATSINYNTTSDYRLKENLVPIAEASSKLRQLKPYAYNFITNPEIPMLGFLAHEVAEVLPAVVTGEKDAVDEEGNIDPQQIDYGMLTPILTAALQEALAHIETLEARLDAAGL